MLDSTMLLYGSASSAFHLSYNYPLIPAGGKNIGLRRGRYIKRVGTSPQAGAWDGRMELWKTTATNNDAPLLNLCVLML